MAKDLSEMSFAELGQLFPILLSEHNPDWAKLYAQEKEAIAAALGEGMVAAIHHIGSTAVPGLTAKPTIDILLEVKNEADPKGIIAGLEGLGYSYSPQPNNPPPHMMFMKGYTPEGFRGQAYHVHVRYPGDWDELRFRDYLIAHPETAAEYARLKQELKARFEHDREGYTQGKGAFVKAVVKKSQEK